VYLWGVKVGEIDIKQFEVLQDLCDRIQAKKDKLVNARPLPKVALQKIKEELTIEWSYNSNGIEGNSLTLRETQLILQEGITVKGKSLKEHFEAHNHDKAIDYLYKILNDGDALRSIDILHLHSLVMRSIEEDFAGRLRNGGVRITGANFIPPNALKVPQLIDDLVDFINTNPLQLNDMILATVLHHQFVWIHPFFDGNGRTVRLVMNLFLMRKGFPPAIILKNDRKKYYEALNQANNGRYEKLGLLMLQAMERSLNIYINSMPYRTPEEDYDLISNIVSESNFVYGQEYISLLARQGKIDAYKEGRNWFTSKSAIAEYMENRKRMRN
jgi:Fic family protein